MKPSINQTLQQELTAQEEGKLHEAELKSIAQVSQPKFSVPQKSMSRKERRKKLAFEKKNKMAIQKIVNANAPSQKQTSHLFDLYQKRRFCEAKKLALEITQAFPKYQFAWKILGATLSQTGRKKESLKATRKCLTLAPEDTEAQFNLGVTLQELGQLDDAEASYTQVIACKPRYAQAYNNLGVTQKGLRKLEDAEANYTTAIALKPDYAEAHNNLGVLLRELGRSNEAEASYTKAIALKPHYAEAYNNLGVLFRDLGRLNKAEASYAKAIALKPDYAEAHNNLGAIRKELGDLGDAFVHYIKAIEIDPEFDDAYRNLSSVLKNARFTSANTNLYPFLIRLFTNGHFMRPKDLAPSILSLLKHDPVIRHFVLDKDFVLSLEEATSAIVSLNSVELLHHLMRVCPLPDLQIEEFFVTMRRLLLTNLDKITDTPENVYFLSTLALHCFTNEYIYFENDEEIQFVDELKSEIAQTIAHSEQPQTTKVLCLASYRPIHQYNWCKKLEALDHLQEVKKRLIGDPLTEKALANDITVLGEISDNVSLKVREQYEKNPYPRWVKIGVPSRAKSIAEVCDDAALYLYDENIKEVTAPDILIAGCGTGQHSIGTASRFSCCQVTAVDLSVASLAYAKRKTDELGIKNIDYWQADILNLKNLELKFDIIECVGVLHHIDDPMVGWRILTGLLEPGGLMKIGLYSKLARNHIAEIRDQITSLKVGISEIDIRNFRHSLAGSSDEDHQRLNASGDFYSLSSLRDLIFHTQEHRFTLPQIQKCLEEMELNFCGFDGDDIIPSFRERYGKKADIHDLALWQQFEENNHNAFAGMYQFWCQKPAV